MLVFQSEKQEFSSAFCYAQAFLSPHTFNTQILKQSKYNFGGGSAF
jgi:hypothetical protein